MAPAAGSGTPTSLGQEGYAEHHTALAGCGADACLSPSARPHQAHGAVVQPREAFSQVYGDRLAWKIEVRQLVRAPENAMRNVVSNCASSRAFRLQVRV